MSVIFPAETCGYQGSFHFCSTGKVAFISRYRNTNDYCVGGKRISVSDDGTVSSSATAADIRAIYAFELAKHEEYMRWHSEQCIKIADWPKKALPFDAGIAKTGGAQ